MSKKGNMDVREKARVSSFHGYSMTTTDPASPSSRGCRFPSGGRGGGGDGRASSSPARAPWRPGGPPRGGVCGGGGAGAGTRGGARGLWALSRGWPRFS